MVRDKKHLEACWKLPSEVSAADARLLFDRACELIRQWRARDADSIAAEFKFQVP